MSARWRSAPTISAPECGVGETQNRNRCVLSRSLPTRLGSAHHLVMTDQNPERLTGESQLTTSTQIGYYYNQSKLIDTYTPKIPREEWQHLESFVRTAARYPTRLTDEMTTRLLRALTNYARWAHHNGLELDKETLLDNDMLEHYAAELRRTSGSDQKQPIYLLRGVANAVHGGRAASFSVPLRVNASHPYTPDELARIGSWARGQRTAHRRRNATAILTLATGAGLKRREINDLRVRDIVDHGTHIEIRVNGRITVMTSDWEDTFRRQVLADRDPDKPVFERNQVTGNRDIVYDFTRSSTIDGIRPHPERLRATWVVNHLRHGTPLDVLVNASGIAPVTLAKFLTHVHRTPDHVAQTLRGGADQ